MLRFLGKRLMHGLAVLWGLVTVIFILFSLLPSPEQLSLGQRSDLMTREAVMKELGLDQPAWKRYMLYLNDLSPLGWHANADADKYGGLKIFAVSENSLRLKLPYLRRSYQSNRGVGELLSDAFTGTLVLSGVAILLSFAVGVFLGIVCALKQGSWLEKSVLLLSGLGISFPSFFLAMIISWFFGYVLQPYTGLSMTGSLYEYDLYGDGQYIKWSHLVLPALALAVRPLAVFVQLSRNSMLEVLQQDYIRTAYAKGLSPGRVIFRHALRNALNPVITSATGWFASLLAGAFFTEFVFNWKGIGKVTIDAVQNSDLPVISGSLLLVGALFVLINITVDLLYTWLDPRVRIS